MTIRRNFLMSEMPMQRHIRQGLISLQFDIDDSEQRPPFIHS
jgi:hypothetical protein